MLARLLGSSILTLGLLGTAGAAMVRPVGPGDGASGAVGSPPSTPTPAAEAPRPRITLRWSTASESENYGFFVLRGESEEGPFKSLNERAIAGAGTSELPHDYVYEDFEVRQGQAYYYYLESVSSRGERQKFSPVIKQTCCKAPKPRQDGKDEKPEGRKPEAGPGRAGDAAK